MICQEMLGNNFNHKYSAISLATLLKDYLNVEYEIKGEVHELLNHNPYLWKIRPIPDKLNFYAGKDVYYLPKIFYMISYRCNNKLYNSLTLQKIFDECNNYLKYVNINLNIKNFNKMNLSKGTILQGIIKYFIYVIY